MALYLAKDLVESNSCARVLVVCSKDILLVVAVGRIAVVTDGITVVLPARDEARGAAAVEKLRELGLSDVVFHQLEITDPPSIARLVDFLKTCFGRLDILFSGLDENKRFGWLWKNCRETYHAAKEGLQTNYYGTKHVIEALLPLLKASSDGRIVNVSSHLGQLRRFRNEELKQELNDTGNLNEERLDELLDMFLKDFEANLIQARGWPMAFSAYKVAKAAMNAYSRILARAHPKMHINCAHPGYVKTDMTINLTGAIFEDFKESLFV
ncbi:(+)-neomenthol dehydrogenase-like [Phragmites australis]|uniref:(+)-neomenthol dehydrogenase-like n=1 Tax=Phragmites australis TaxID=29695 RepID=UPI002D778B34|nr:(+)-neomenthol dehydrogenase-like [Phragmites australis]